MAHDDEERMNHGVNRTPGDGEREMSSGADDHVDEGLVHAWLDGELTDAQASAIEMHLASCNACSALVAEARGLIAASSRIVAALDDVPEDVIPTPMEGVAEAVSMAAPLRVVRANAGDVSAPSTDGRRGGMRRPFWQTRGLAAAAALFLGVTSYAVLRTRGTHSVAEVAGATDDRATTRSPLPAASAASTPNAGTAPQPVAASDLATAAPATGDSRRATANASPSPSVGPERERATADALALRRTPPPAPVVPQQRTTASAAPSMAGSSGIAADASAKAAQRAVMEPPTSANSVSTQSAVAASGAQTAADTAAMRRREAQLSTVVATAATAATTATPTPVARDASVSAMVGAGRVAASPAPPPRSEPSASERELLQRARSVTGCYLLTPATNDAPPALARFPARMALVDSLAPMLSPARELTTPTTSAAGAASAPPPVASDAPRLSFANVSPHRLLVVRSLDARIDALGSSVRWEPLEGSLARLLAIKGGDTTALIVRLGETLGGVRTVRCD